MSCFDGKMETIFGLNSQNVYQFPGVTNDYTKSRFCDSSWYVCFLALSIPTLDFFTSLICHSIKLAHSMVTLSTFSACRSMLAWLTLSRSVTSPVSELLLVVMKLALLSTNQKNIIFRISLRVDWNTKISSNFLSNVAIPWGEYTIFEWTDIWCSILRQWSTSKVQKLPLYQKFMTNFAGI